MPTRTSRPRWATPGLLCLEDRITPASDPRVIVSSDQGFPPTVQVYNTGGSLIGQFNAFGGTFTGGVRTAVGDINGDNVLDIFCAPGPSGAPFVTVFDGRNFAFLRRIQVYGAAFTNGVNLAVGDVIGNTNVELITAPDVGGAPFVNVFDPVAGTFLRQYQVYGSTFTNGVRVAAGDVYGDQRLEILVVPQAGGLPAVNVFNPLTGGLLRSFLAYENSFTAGLYLTTGQINGTGPGEVIVGPGTTNTGRTTIKIFDGGSFFLINEYSVSPLPMSIRVASVDVNGDSRDDIIVGTGRNDPPHVYYLNGTNGSVITDFAALQPYFLGGVFVSAGD